MTGEGLRTAAGTGRAFGLRAAVCKQPKDERVVNAITDAGHSPALIT